MSVHALAKPELEVDLTTRRVYVNGREVILTYSEYQLLAALAADGKAQSRDDLLAAIGWRGEGFDTRTVDAHLYRLRKKVGMARVVSVPRFGYRLGEGVTVHRLVEEPKKQTERVGVACPQCGTALKADLMLVVQR